MRRISCVFLGFIPTIFLFAQSAPGNKEPTSTVTGSPVEMAEPVAQLETEQADLAIQLANSLAREKRYSEALQAYQEFVRVFAFSSRKREARENMARIYERRQRYDRAIEQYEALYRELGISQLGLAYHLEAARLYELAGQEEAAVNIYKELNSLDPGSEAAMKARMRMEALNLLQKSGDYSSVSNPTP